MSVAGTPIVVTHRLSKRYGSTEALRDLDLQIERGEVFGYLGPNGAGKTTTLRLLLGLLRPTSGGAEIDGLDTWSESVEVRRRVGYLSGEPALYGNLTGAQHIEYLGRLRRVSAQAAANRLAERLSLDLGRPARELSKGNRQKLALLLALMAQPELLVLDEPTGGLDPLAQQEFHALMREHTQRGGTVLLSSHVLSEVQRIADRVGVLREGELIALERLDDLRERSLHHIRATFAEAVDPGAFHGLPGLRNLRVEDHTLVCSAPETTLDALLKEVSRHTVVDFECAEAELEETFLAFYTQEAVHAS